MQDQIHKFLERCNGHASSAAIASNVLRLRNATPAMAERVVSSLLNAESRFATDGVGNWYLVQTPRTKAAPKLQQAALVFTPMRAAVLQHANRIVLGWKLLSNKEQHLAEIVIHEEAQQHESSGLPQKSQEEFLRRHFPNLQTCVLLAWDLTAVRAALRKITANVADAWLPPTMISLQNLSRNLLCLSHKPKLHSVYQKLLSTPPRSESWADQFEAQIEIWEALQQRCHNNGLQNWEQIAHYSRRLQRTSFEQFDFAAKDLDNLPETPGVYVMKDREERVIYVGKATNLRERVRSYFANDFTDEAKLQQIRARVARLHFELYDTELEALLREQALIKRFRPAFNRQIEVHSQVAPQAEKLRGIFLVPLRAQMSSATKGRVIIYFLSSQSLKRLPVNLARIPKQRIHKALANYLQSGTSLVKAQLAQQTQVEIATRWFHQNRALISTLTPHESDPAGEVEERLLSLLHAPEIFHERVQLA